MNKKIFLALLVIALGAVDVAHAESLVAQDARGNTATVFNEPCSSEKAIGHLPALNKVVGDEIPPTALGKAVTNINGQTKQACWLGIGSDVVFVDEDGKLFKLSAEFFKKPDVI